MGFFFFLVVCHLISMVLLAAYSKSRCFTSCQAQTGLKLSTKDTSSERLGNSHKPGGTAKYVMQKRMTRKMAMRKNRPRRIREPQLR